MKYFKDAYGVVYAYEHQEDREQFGSPDLVEMTSSEIKAHIAPPKIDPLIAIAARRYKAETSGIAWQGFGIATDRESQDKIVQETRAIDRGLRVDGKGWKCIDLATGIVVFRSTTNAEMMTVADAVYDYVSACFAREEVLLSEIAAGTYDPAMLEAGWPA